MNALSSDSTANATRSAGSHPMAACNTTIADSLFTSGWRARQHKAAGAIQRAMQLTDIEIAIYEQYLEEERDRAEHPEDYPTEAELRRAFLGEEYR